MSLFEYKIKMWQLWKKYVLNAFKNEREEYHIGYLHYSEGKSDLVCIPTEELIETIESILIILGYQPNYFSFGDQGQVTSMRKMYVDPEGFWRQIHIRVHEDGEIRGHDELSYEESAIEHVNSTGARPIQYEEVFSVLHSLENL
jgi:hypothetical protein